MTRVTRSDSRSVILPMRPPMGSQMKLALMTPQRVATKAPAMEWPRLDGSFRFSSTWVSETTVPMMPTVGAKPPSELKNLLAERPTFSVAAASSSIMIRSSSASMPSATFCSAFLRKGSFTSADFASRASRPSLRATSASSTSRSMSFVSLPPLKRNAFGGVLMAVIASGSVVEAMPTPMAPPKTRINGAGMMSAIGLAPSRNAIVSREPKATRMPPRVAGSMSGPPVGARVHRARRSLGAVDDTESVPPSRRRRNGGRAVEMHRVRERDDARAVFRNLLDDLADRLGHDECRSVDQHDRRVRRLLDPLDEVRIHREGAPVQSGQQNHSSPHPWDRPAPVHGTRMCRYPDHRHCRVLGQAALVPTSGAMAPEATSAVGAYGARRNKRSGRYGARSNKRSGRASLRELPLCATLRLRKPPKVATVDAERPRRRAGLGIGAVGQGDVSASAASAPAGSRPRS